MRFYLLLLFPSILLGQHGRFYSNPPNNINPVYSAKNCPVSSASPISCSFSVPVGSAIFGGISIGSTTAALTSVVTNGGDNFTIEPVYVNGTTWESYSFYMCAVTTAVTSVTLTFTGTSAYPPYVSLVALYGTNSACLDGYKKNQNTAAATALSLGANTITPTQINDLILGIGTNHCGGTFTAGNDGHTNPYTIALDNNGVTGIEYRSEATINAFDSTMTGPSCSWNLETFAVKGYATMDGLPVNWNSNGRNYINTTLGNGRLYSPAPTIGGLVDFGLGGANNTAPTATTVFNSIVGSVVANSSNVSLAGMGSGAKFLNTQTTTLPFGVVIGSTLYSGNGGLSFGGATTGSTTTGIGDMGLQNLSGATASTSLGFSVWTNCSNTIGNDCGAVGGLFGTTGYAVAHFGNIPSDSTNIQALPVMSLAMENQAGGAIVWHIAPNQTWYRVNILMNATGNDYMVVCDSKGRFLYNWTMTANGVNAIDVDIGFSGEEPAVPVGTNVYWADYVYSPTGTFRLNGPCF